MSVFELILSPFIFIIEQIFLFSYNITGDYGWAIILLSFFISLLLLPVFIYIEKSKKKTDAVKYKMQPLVDEIKRCYKGQERFYYLKTLNRQHGYSPFKAMIPILSLLLQIPFFIAAYQYLEHFEALQGVSFSFIKDLSQPDAVFGVINIIPIMMTVVNLITAWFYTRNGNTGERKQMLIVALAFLILLYKLPAGLVMYWTMNNVFSFFRLFITNPEVFKEHRENTEKKNNFSVKSFLQDNILQLSVKPYIYYSMLFLAVYFYFASKFYFLGENTQLSIISALFLLSIQLIGIIYFIKSKNSVNTFLFGVIIFILIMLSSVQLLNVVTMAIGKGVSFTIFSIKLQTGGCTPTDFLLPGILFTFFTTFFYSKLEKIDIKLEVGNIWGIYILSIIFILGLIFLWHPLIIFSSSPQTFGFPAISIVRNNFPLFIESLVLFIFVFLIVPKRIKQYLTYLMLFIVLVVFINSSIIPINLGSLQENRFSLQENLAEPIFKYIIESVVLLAISVLLKKVFTDSKRNYLIIGLLLLNTIFIINGLYSNINKGVFFEKETEKTESAGISFSKIDKNIVYFIADGVQGWFIKQMVEEEPELKNIFSGFTWYPNTISMANYTHASVPSLLAGYHYSIDSMNNDNANSIEEKWQIASKIFVDKAIRKGYSFNSDKQHYFKKVEKKIGTIPLWTKSWKKLDKYINLGQKHEVWYTRLFENALFVSVPLIFKPKIYNDTKWLIKKKSKISSYMFEWYNFIRILPFISKTDAPNSSFIYFHNEAAHNPWHIIKDNGQVVNATPYENNKWIINQLAKWIEWMKDNDVYDNTKIVIVSDHGPSWYESDFNPDFKSPVNWKQNSININPKMFWRLNPLLMVKEFGEKKELKEDWRLMCNSDAAYITFDSNYINKLPNDRILNSYFTIWEGNMEEQSGMKIESKFEVHTNIFDLNNWKKIK